MQRAGNFGSRSLRFGGVAGTGKVNPMASCIPAAGGPKKKDGKRLSMSKLTLIAGEKKKRNTKPKPLCQYDFDTSKERQEDPRRLVCEMHRAPHFVFVDWITPRAQLLKELAERGFLRKGGAAWNEIFS